MRTGTPYIFYILKALLPLMMTIGITSVGAAQPIEFEHISVTHGLSQNSALRIAQDKQGFIWVGTRYGLNRYDGHHFKLYKNEPADTNTLSGIYIIDLATDAEGRLWIATDKGLDQYDPVRDVFRHIPLNNPLKPKDSDYFVNCIFGDSSGNTWVGTSSGLVLIPKGAAEGVRTFLYPGIPELSPGNNILTICPDHHGYIWMGTAGGLVRMAPQDTGYVYTVYRHESGRSGSLSDNFITTITEDRNGHLWVGTQKGGLNVLNEATGTFTLYQYSPDQPFGLLSNNIRRIISDREGKVWIGTQEGLNIFDTATRTFRSCQHDAANKKSLSQNSVYGLLQDNNGSIWVGTYFGGVNVSHAYTTHFTVFQNDQTVSSIDNNVVSGITEDGQHNLWLGTEGGGLNYYDRRKGVFIAYKNKPGVTSSLGSNLVKSLYRDRGGDIWVGTHGGGLNLLDQAHGGFTRFLYVPEEPSTFHFEINAILEDSKGILWVGYQNTLEFFHRTVNGWEACPGPLPPSTFGKIQSLAEDNEQNIWIGTLTGLYRFNRLTGKYTPVTGEYINCLKEDNQGHICVGIYFGGLAMYDPHTLKRTLYDRKDGLPNNNVVGILQDDGGRLWVSTDNGLSRLDLQTKQFRNYTQSDGLAANEFNYNSSYKSSQGELFFGGYNGVTSFYPARIETNQQTAPLVLTSFKLFNDEVVVNGKDGLLKTNIAFAKRITLHYKQNVFTLEFALLNYIKSDKNRYAYRVEGFEKDWHYTTIPSANYMNLPPGNYTLVVKGANNDGIWSAPVYLQVVVLPPFWQTWWAYLLYILFIGSILFLITRFFVLRALLRKDQALNQAKLNFFTNISHEIRTHLTLVSGPIEKMALHEKENGPLSHQLRYVKGNTDRLLKLVEELMDFRKAESRHLQLHVSRQNLVSFVRNIYTSFGELARNRRIGTDFLSTGEEISVYFDRVQLEKVFYNLLTNAFKFTPDGGTISITIEAKKDNVEIRVMDNGKGIAPESISRLFENYFQENDQHTQNTGYGIGLALSRSIVQLHKGTLTVSSELANDPAANRTCFTVTLLAGTGHFRKEMLDTAPPGEIVAVSSTAPVADTGTPPSTGKRSKEKPTLLLVEDNADIRAFIMQSLASAYNLLESPDGRHGWETAIRQLPDLIVSDVMMPGMDGITLCGQLKEDQRTNHIPVILLTAKAGMESLISGLERRADIYLTKPFSIQVLELHIRNLLAAAATIRQKFSHQLAWQSPGPGPAAVQDEFLSKLVGVIEENMDDSEFDVPMLCVKMAMSQFILYKKVKAITDMSVGDLIKQVRLKKAAWLLEQKQLTVNEIAYTVGFSDSKYFSKEFKKLFGKTPREYGRADD